MKEKQVRGYFAVPNDAKSNYVQEEFKGQVLDEEVKFPRELGVAHPFEFEDVEKVYKSVGLVNGACNKIVDNIIGEFSVKAKNTKVKALIDSFIKNSNLKVFLREWVMEAVVKGNGFLELDLKNEKVRALNSCDMYVVRDKKGNVKGYNQFIGKSFKGFTMTNRNTIPFLPNQIAHLKINKIPGEAYGYGLVMSNEKVIENLVLNEADLHKLISRKAGAPIHVKVGQPGEVTDPTAVDAISNNLKYMTNRTEWVTDANLTMEILNFGDVGKNLTDTLNHDVEMFAFGMQIPAVLLGMANVAEGLATTQLEAFSRMISSIQEDIETTIEQTIFQPLLMNNSLADEVEFIWNLPGEEEINTRLTQLNTLLQNPFISDGMRNQMQLEIARLLNFENAENLVNTPNTQGNTADKNPKFDPEGNIFEPKQPEKEDKERKKEENIKQPEVPGEKNVKQETEIQVTELPVTICPLKECGCKITEADEGQMTLKEFTNIAEIGGFNYSDYLIRILRRIKTDKFDTLQAITEKDAEDGLLTNEQIEKLRVILKDGFRKNKSIADIEKDVKDNLNLKDRIAENGAKIPAELRPNMISRTETIRLANLGLLDTYKENSVSKVRYLAALSDRTCEVCQRHNGEVFSLEESYGMIPLHVNCRCTWLSIVE